MRRRFLSLSLMLAAVAACSAAPAGRTASSTPKATPAAVGRVAPPSALPARVFSPYDGNPGFERLFQRLAAIEAGHGGTVDILQLGDSHTAGGVFTTRLRDALQERFGSAGPGYMPAGKPYIGSRRPDVAVTQEGKWQYFNSLSDTPPPGWGMTGFVARSRARGAAISVTPKDGLGFDIAGVTIVRQPGGGDLLVLIDDRVVKQIATQGPAGQADWITLPTAGQAQQLKLVAADGRPVDIAGWSLDRAKPGVVFDSAGVVGARLTTMDRWNPETVALELAKRKPDLVILAYGTNEGFDRDLDMTAYQDRFKAALRRLNAGPVAVIVLGPLDGQAESAACKKVANKDAVFPCQDTPPPLGKCAWYTPPMLGRVRSLQAQGAKSGDYVFWDWSQLMPGACGMDRWVRQAVPLARADHVHLTPEGYTLTANAFFAWLMDQYQGYIQPGAAPPRSVVAGDTGVAAGR
ncbi:GDSL-type esterase/lipase family protein [Nitrospirillum pindoramense]|uniref:GDSL-like lipase/acylhydrolase family protein n=1 Tax=Nitrospirillum amazonense TaxID=28077 RepID=A0A560GQH7_9PROT|nr:GDSL-type esterase/lipase family protein [Nitrospirillum amazonense]TWB35740.1 GDSL-like lipase/acylhydrolase family protein [Nitrospirillum amazonense]